MSRRTTRPVAPLVVLAAVLGAPASTAAQSAGEQGLRLEELLTVARERNPGLQALESAAEAAAHRVPEASAFPDPTLQLGIMNFGVPDLNADMPMSMAPSVQLMQRVPFPGTRGLEGEIAAHGRAMAEEGANEGWWTTRARAADLFYGLYALDRRIEVMEETLLLLQDFQQVAKALYGSGRGRQADVLRADVEVARVDGDIRQMKARRLSVSARINALLDLPAETPVASPVLGPLPLDLPSQDSLMAMARESRPALERERLGVAQARKRVELAGRRIWPDFTVGLSYGQRDRGMGTERMASAMVGFSLPVHAGSRQWARRDEAEAMRRMVEARLDGAEADVDARISELLAEAGRTRSLSTLYREEVLPQARATVESAFSSYRVGAVDFLTLVDAQMTVNRYEGELFQLVADYGAAIAALESTVGRALPRSGRTLAVQP